MYLPLLQHNSKTHTVQQCCHFPHGIAWYQSPLSFIGFMPISDVQSILYFILYKADPIPPKQENAETTLAWPFMMWQLVSFPSPGGCSSHSAAKGHHTHCSLPHPGLFLFLFSPSFISSSCREQIPKSTPQALSRNFQERKCCCSLKVIFFFWMSTFKVLEQSRAMAAAVLVTAWQSQGSDGARSRQRRASRGMDFWNRNSSYGSWKYCQFFPLQGTKVHGKFKRLKQSSVICSSDLLIPTMKVSTPGWEEHLGTGCI